MRGRWMQEESGGGRVTRAGEVDPHVQRQRRRGAPLVRVYTFFWLPRVKDTADEERK